MIHEHQVRERAYYIWEDEGRVFGQADAHWLKAEAELHAATPLTVQPVAEVTAISPAKTLKPAASRAKAKAEKAPAAKVAKASAKAPAKTKRVPRGGEAAAPAFH